MIGVGIVGMGYASQTFHMPLILATPGLDLRAVSSSDPAKVALAVPDIAHEASATALFARPDIDVVIIPTPNETHHALAAAALAAGKHVVLDKPFVLTVAEADDLIARATQARRLLTVFHNRRWDSDFLTLRRVLDAGTLGAVRWMQSSFDRFRPGVRARWRESASPGAGLWYDLGPHLLDQALQLFGAPQNLWLHRRMQRDGALSDDVFHAVLDYPQHSVVLQASALAAVPAPRFVVHGTRGSFVAEGLDPQEAALKAGGLPGEEGWGLGQAVPQLVLGEEGPDRVVCPAAQVPGDYRLFYTQLRDAIRTGSEPPVTAAQAREVMVWLERGALSAEPRACRA